MNIDTNTVVSTTEANQNFSKVTRIADRYGRAVVFKNNVPRYLVVQFTIADEVEAAGVPVLPDELFRFIVNLADALPE